MTDNPTSSWAEFLRFRFVIGELIPWLFTGAGLVALTFYRDVQARERQLADTQRLAQDAQLLALRYQINPHFLFNTLNSISALVLDDRKEDAEDMLLRLSAFFRQTLAIDPAQSITLAQEIELQRTYLAIEQRRFGDMLRVEVAMPAALATALVPSLILQ